MAVTPVLAGHALADPSDYDEQRIVRAASRTKASGKRTIDVVDDSAEIAFTLRWRNLTISQRNTLWTAYQAAVAGVVSFTTIEGATYDVQADLEGSPGIPLSAFISAGSTRYRGEIKLRTTA